MEFELDDINVADLTINGPAQFIGERFRDLWRVQATQSCELNLAGPPLKE